MQSLYFIKEYLYFIMQYLYFIIQSLYVIIHAGFITQRKLKVIRMNSFDLCLTGGFMYKYNSLLKKNAEILSAVVLPSIHSSVLILIKHAK